MTRIMIVDDYKAVRDSLKRLLEAESDFEVVGEAASGLEVEPLVDRLKPDILILDIGLPDMSGLEVLQRLGTRLKTLHVIILSMHNDAERIAQAFKNGASGYVQKDHSATEVIDAIYQILEGHQYFNA